jgi:predicted permease
MGSDTLWMAQQGSSRSATTTLAKLRPGVDRDAAQEAIAAAGPATADDAWLGFVMSPRDYVGHTLQETVRMLAGAVALLLLLASVNVANLILSRNRTRAHELAVRTALGASRRRLMRLLLAESTLVAIAGGVLGLLLAAWGLEALDRLRPVDLRALERASLDRLVVWFAAALTAGTALLVGLLPAIRAARAAPRTALSAGGRSVAGGGHIGRGLLSAVQIGVALVLVIGALLLTRSLANLVSVDPGFDPEGILTVDLKLPSGPDVDAAARDRFLRDLADSVRELPDVASATFASGIPPRSGITFGVIEIDGGPPPGADPSTISYGAVRPGYFETMRIPVREGRAFTADDLTAGVPVVMVSETFARRYFADRPAVGARFRMNAGDAFAAVVGVAADVKANGLHASVLNTMQIYRPLSPRSSVMLIVRVRQGDPLALTDALKARIWALDPGLPVTEVATAASQLRRATATPRFGLVLLGLFAVIGLALAAVGVFGVLMLVAGQRRREMAIRLSLGATRTQVIGRLGRYIGWVTVLGVALGIGGAIQLSSMIASLLTGVTATDVPTYAAAALTVLAAAVLAGLVPARRLATVEPAEVLRAE